MTKTKRFYPAQVFRRLAGKHLSELSALQTRALAQGLHRSRKTNLVITVINDVITVHNVADIGRRILEDLRSTAKLMTLPSNKMQVPETSPVPELLSNAA